MAEHRAPPAWSRDSLALRLADPAAMAAIGPHAAWGHGDGAGVRVAVIDSGIDAGHPALGGCVDVEGGVALELTSDGEVIEWPGPHGDLFGHGTACASIIHSLAPGATIASVRVLNRRLAGRSEVFLHGLAWAISRRFDVINLSLGTQRRDRALAFYELCDEAYFRGCFVVTAANNAPRPTFPALFASVASVACNHATDPWRFHYNPEPPTEFLARGIDVDVAWLGGATIRATGNSYAAPHIAGLAALVRSQHPGATPFQIKAALASAAVNVGPAAVAGRLSRPGDRRPATRPSRASRILQAFDAGAPT
jgi:subtilisin family serine protease